MFWRSTLRTFNKTQLSKNEANHCLGALGWTKPMVHIFPRSQIHLSLTIHLGKCV